MSEQSGTDQSQTPGVNLDSIIRPRERGLKLLRRLFIYHGILILTILFVAIKYPSYLQYLPIGGVTQLEAAGDVRVTTPAEASRWDNPDEETPMVNSLIDATTQLDRLGYARKLVIVLGGVWILMLPISWVNKGMHEGGNFDHSLDETTLILPGVVASIVMVVQHSLALAFSLAGIVAGVQFRRALQDTYDALFILSAIGVGIAAGVEALEIAAILSIFFTYATLYVTFCGDGMETHHVMRKKLVKEYNRRATDKAQGEEGSRRAADRAPGKEDRRRAADRDAAED